MARGLGGKAWNRQQRTFVLGRNSGKGPLHRIANLETYATTPSAGEIGLGPMGGFFPKKITIPVFNRFRHPSIGCKANQIHDHHPTTMSTTATESCPTSMQRPTPVAEHAWLDQLVGNWESEVVLNCGPGSPPMKNNGSETVTSLGGFWIVSEVASLNPQIPYKHIFTVGYDPTLGKYVGSRVDNMNGKLWTYEGTVTGDTLTLECETTCPMGSGEVRRFREVLRLVDADHKTFSTSMQMDDGSWSDCVTGSARRVK